MKRNVLYLIILVLLSVIVYFLYIKKEASPYSKNEANFTVEDTAKISQIELLDMQGHYIKLQRTTQGWTLNDSLTPRPDAIQSILETLHLQAPEQTVPASYHDNVIKALSGQHIKVKIFDGEKLTHSFYVAQYPGVNNATYMLNENAQQPFIVKKPLSNDFLGVRFFTSLQDWRDKRLFYSTEDIEKVKVQYTDSLQYSFTLLANNNSVQNDLGNAQPANAKFVQSYIQSLSKIYCIGFENTNMQKDSIIHYGKSLATVTIKHKNEPSHILTLYFRPIDKGTKAQIKIDGRNYDFDSFFGYYDQKDFVLINRKTAEKILRSYPEFLKP
ncbi:MAG: DUF4340 domain-containing protein [Chitinophagaceae bacterium]